MEHIGFYLRDIYFNNRKGLYAFRKGEIIKYLFFLEGDLIFAKSNQKEELIGNILFRLGKLHDEAFSHIDKFIEPMETIGSVLIKNGFICEDDLINGLTYQMREIVLNLFSEFDGEMGFQEREIPKERVYETRINIPILIEDGIRRMKYHPKLKEFLQDKALFQNNKDFYFRLTEDEKEIHANIENGIISNDLLLSLRARKEIFWKSIYLFYCLDIIDLKETEISKKKIETKKEADAAKVKEQNTVKEEEAEPAKKVVPGPDVTKVLELYDKLESMSYYEILGVSQESAVVEIKKAYFQLARKYHPDLFSGMIDNDSKKKVSGVFDFLTKSYRTLSDESARKEYNDKLEEGPKDDFKEKIKRGEIRFRQAKTLYDQARYEEARIFLEEAVRLDTTKAKYFLLLGMVESKLPDLLRQSEHHLLQASEIEPWNTDILLALGLLYKQVGMPVKAAKQFRKILGYDPDHKVARRELNMADDHGKKKGLKDYLSMDFFGKKKK
jgi:tetratricopeptide (TPR) repeat protein